MSKELRVKIMTDTGTDPWAKQKWAYDELVNAIKKHSVANLNPMQLARDFPIRIKSDTIDTANANIQTFFEEIDFFTRSTQCCHRCSSRQKNTSRKQIQE